MSLFTIIYVISSTRRLSDAELEAIFSSANDLNAKNDITSMLLYRDGNFMQAIEGPEEAVRETYRRIVNDKRHQGVITLVAEHIAQSEFSEWRMGFENLDTSSRALKAQHEFEPSAVFNSFFNPALEERGLSYRLLADFRNRAVA